MNITRQYSIKRTQEFYIHGFSQIYFRIHFPCTQISPGFKLCFLKLLLLLYSALFSELLCYIRCNIYIYTDAVKFVKVWCKLIFEFSFIFLVLKYPWGSSFVGLSFYIIYYTHIQYCLCITIVMEKRQRSDVKLSESLTSLALIWAQVGAPWNPSDHHSTIVLRGIRGHAIGPHSAEKRQLLGQPMWVFPVWTKVHCLNCAR